VVQQQHALADFGVDHFNPVGKAWFFVHDVAVDAELPEFGIGQVEIALEGFWRKAGNTVSHDRAPSQ
jgi:hypothetical protein